MVVGIEVFDGTVPPQPVEKKRDMQKRDMKVMRITLLHNIVSPPIFFWLMLRNGASETEFLGETRFLFTCQFQLARHWSHESLHKGASFDTRFQCSIRVVAPRGWR